MGWDKLSGGSGGVGKRLGGGSLPKVTPCSLDLGDPCSVWLCTVIGLHDTPQAQLYLFSAADLPTPKVLHHIGTRAEGTGPCPCGPWHRQGFGIIWKQTRGLP